MYLQAASLLTGWQPHIGLNVAHTRSIPMTLPTAGKATKNAEWAFVQLFTLARQRKHIQCKTAR